MGCEKRVELFKVQFPCVPLMFLGAAEPWQVDLPSFPFPFLPLANRQSVLLLYLHQFREASGKIYDSNDVLIFTGFPSAIPGPLSSRLGSRCSAPSREQLSCSYVGDRRQEV